MYSVHEEHRIEGSLQLVRAQQPNSNTLHDGKASRVHEWMSSAVHEWIDTGQSLSLCRERSRECNGTRGKEHDVGVVESAT
jgi:hypothetical protein